MASVRLVDHRAGLQPCRRSLNFRQLRPRHSSLARDTVLAHAHHQSLYPIHVSTNPSTGTTPAVSPQPLVFQGTRRAARGAALGAGKNAPSSPYRAAQLKSGSGQNIPMLGAIAQGWEGGFSSSAGGGGGGGGGGVFVRWGGGGWQGLPGRSQGPFWLVCLALVTLLTALSRAVPYVVALGGKRPREVNPVSGPRGLWRSRGGQQVVPCRRSVAVKRIDVSMTEAASLNLEWAVAAGVLAICAASVAIYHRQPPPPSLPLHPAPICRQETPPSTACVETLRKEPTPTTNDVLRANSTVELPPTAFDAAEAAHAKQPDERSLYLDSNALLLRSASAALPPLPKDPSFPQLQHFWETASTPLTSVASGDLLRSQSLSVSSELPCHRCPPSFSALGRSITAPVRRPFAPPTWPVPHEQPYDSDGNSGAPPTKRRRSISQAQCHGAYLEHATVSLTCRTRVPPSPPPPAPTSEGSPLGMKMKRTSSDGTFAVPQQPTLSPRKLTLTIPPMSPVSPGTPPTFGGLTMHSQSTNSCEAPSTASSQEYIRFPSHASSSSQASPFTSPRWLARDSSVPLDTNHDPHRELEYVPEGSPVAYPAPACASCDASAWPGTMGPLMGVFDLSQQQPRGPWEADSTTGGCKCDRALDGFVGLNEEGSDYDELASPSYCSFPRGVGSFGVHEAHTSLTNAGI